MQVAVAHVAEGANAQPVLLRDAGNEADHAGQFAAEHGDVLDDGRGRNAGERGEGGAAGGELVDKL